MRLTLLIPTILTLASPAFAQEAPAVCGNGVDRSAEIFALGRLLQTSPSIETANVIAQQMWEIWMTAPDDQAQDLLDRGMAQRAAGDFSASVETLDALIAYCPDYVEGYSQRGFTNFERGAYEEALADAEAALAIDPIHLGVLNGRALSLLQLGRLEDAQTAYDAFRTVNPWLPPQQFVPEPPGETL